MVTVATKILPTTKVCGLDVVPFTYAECVEFILNRAKTGEGAWVVTLNLEMVSRATRKPEYSQMLRTADFFFADGMPIVWATHVKKGAIKAPERIAGCDMTLDLIKGINPELVAIVGGIDPLAALVKQDIEGRDRIYINNGKIDTSPEMIDQLSEELKGRRLVFLALGVPKQDQLAFELRKRMPEAVFIGVGGTFELMSGMKKRAPGWMQRIGLEGLFRVCYEPRRLGRRVFIEYWAGGFAVIGDVLRSRRQTTAP